MQSSKQNLKMNRRNERGNMLVLIVCISVMVFVPIIIFICQLSPYFVCRGKAENVVQAAAIVAANDLSRIVINDSHFGYVSLSNHPATGKATRAQDGEALPVTGINTLIGTLRHNAAVAAAMRNDTINNLVDIDSRFLYKTTRDLQSKLADCLTGFDEGTFDKDGKSVDAMDDVKTFLSQNLPPNLEIKTVKMTLGWLEDGSDTTIDVPQPAQYSLVSEQDVVDGKYLAFKNYPIKNINFSFAGLGKQAHLVSGKKFKEADIYHMSSVIKLECTLVSKEDHQAVSEITVCSQASTQPDESLNGAMTLRFTGRPMPGLLSWNDLLVNGSFFDNKQTSYFVTGGDFPYDPTARMYESRYQTPEGTSERFANHFYNWLRNGKMRPRIDSVLSMLNQPFDSTSNQIYTYQFDKDGKIVRKSFNGDQFEPPVTADGQLSTMSDTRIKSGSSAIILFRDNVDKLASTSGKHGGQPLAGYPIDGSIKAPQELAQNFSKRSSYRDGLALDIEIGGTGASTAQDDIDRMIKFTANRSI